MTTKNSKAIITAAQKAISAEAQGDDVGARNHGERCGMLAATRGLDLETLWSSEPGFCRSGGAPMAAAWAAVVDGYYAVA